MDNEIKYYVVEGWVSANPDKKLNSNIRIVAIPRDFPFLPNDTNGHNSLRHLRHYDPKWKQLHKISSKTADKICDEKFILDCYDFVLTPYDKKFNEYSFDLLQHTVHGKYDNEFSGLHLISSFNKDIESIEQTKPEDINGIWEAKIKLNNKRRNKIYEKTSTFFPKNWTPSHFMFESFSAIESLQISPTTNEYDSITKSGIPVKIIIKNNCAKTIYPLYTEPKASS